MRRTSGHSSDLGILPTLATGMRKPLDHRQEDALARMREVLQDDLLTLTVGGVSLQENFAEHRCAVSCVVREQPGDTPLAIEATGVGLIDAFFAGLGAHYAGEHPSLRTLRFTGFEVTGLMAESDSANATDAKADATIRVANSYGAEFEFGAITSSVAHSSIECVLAAVEYFVNSERATVRMFRALEHYRQEGRGDLVSKYTDLLSEMVRNTSYSEVIEGLRQRNG